ncbi:uncharacterized protein LOC115879916 isoform X2 [Sitophilus oryzae]|nr:uncharacterized protein LOC115879916 isoform X2 [Sitophilus oryzae]XP_030752831.1 uncharacterized protein LOC115879916 isoform X2 [Sitophilus oryzae]XP_030752832.1 uncharacterized protein LOC115879916 isoform X2 [Sitophilus oryzae]
MAGWPWAGLRTVSFARCLLAPLASPFYRFLARFSGRRRRISSYHKKYPPPWHFLVLHLVLVSSLVSIVEACSSRSTPKPRPPAPTPRPNITFLTYECPPAYAAWFCLNGATCFTVKIGDSLLYNCMCAEGYQGSRCEYKDLDGSYMPSQRRFMLETASIAGGATIAVFSAVILCLAAYLRWRRSKKSASTDQVDGAPHPRPQPVFGVRHAQGHNLVPIRGDSLSPLRAVQVNSHGTSSLDTIGGNNLPPREPNLVHFPRAHAQNANEEIRIHDSTCLPQDRGDLTTALPREAPPWNNLK